MIPQLEIRSIPENEKKKVASFALKTWNQYNKEKNFMYKEKVFRFAAYLNGKIVGYMYGNTNGSVAYLDDILVDREHRSKGIGTKLLRKFEDIARANRCHACLLATTDKHAQAIIFYKKNGYKIEARLKKMYWGCTEYYMVKRLKK